MTELRIEVTDQHNPAATADPNGEYRVEVIRRQLDAADVYPATMRYNDTLDVVETTFDGGATWVTAPGLDPRKVSRLPPQTGGAALCDSSASMVTYLMDFLSTVTGVVEAGATATAAAAAVIGFLKILGGWAILWELTVAFGVQLIAIGAIGINAAFTAATWDALLCILVDRSNAEGRLDDSVMVTIGDDIDAHADISDIAATVLRAIMGLMGAGGLNDAGALRLGSGDCGDCGAGEWCYHFDLTASAEGWVPVPGQGAYSAGVGMVTTDFTSGGTRSRLFIATRAFASTTITAISMQFNHTVGSSNLAGDRLRIGDQVANFQTTTVSPPNGLRVYAWTGSRVMTSIGLMVRTSQRNNASFSGAATLLSVTIRGTGTNPFGADNCI